MVPCSEKFAVLEEIMMSTAYGKNRMKLLAGVLFITIFVFVLSASSRATVIYTSSLSEYQNVEFPESLTLFVDKDITIRKLSTRLVTDMDVNYFDVQIIPVGNHTLTVDGRSISSPIKDAIDVKSLTIYDGVNLKVFSNAVGISCIGDLTINKANVSVQCFGESSVYQAFYVQTKNFIFVGSKIVEPADAYCDHYTIKDSSSHESSPKVRIAPIEPPAEKKKPAANPITAKAKKVTVKASKVKKKNQTIKSAEYLTVSKAQGKLTYKLAKVTKTKFKKYFKVNASTGKITVKKGLKKGTYKLKIKVTAAGNTNYLSGTKSVTVKVIVK